MSIYTRTHHTLKIAGMVWVFLLLQSNVSYAAENKKWQHCKADFAPKLSQFDFATDKAGNNVSTIEANSASVEQRNFYNLQGNVVFHLQDMALHADEAKYQQDNNKIHASGNVRYETLSSVILGDSAKINSNDSQGVINNARIWDDTNHLRGAAQTIELVNAHTSRLTQVSFTRCENESQDWILNASELKLDQQENEGVAYNATLKFMDIPIFYFPYLSFPLQGRKTGFLIPNMANSNVSGTELTIPYYFNIAPHRDATLTPRYFSKRGTQIMSEVRYLNQRNFGQLNVDYLKSDELYKDDRSMVEFIHSASIDGGWRADINYKRVSDQDYLNTFSEDLGGASYTHLERHINLDFYHLQYNFSAQVQDYQTVDETIDISAKPYERLPQLELNLRPILVASNTYMTMDSELVNFYRADSTRALRLDVAPQLRWTYQRAAGYVEPKIKWRHTQYSLDNHQPGADDNFSRSLPIVSIDSGVYFERDVQWRSQSLLQTLEPRLFYLYAPYRNQENLIVNQNGNSVTFDSALPQFTFSQMFTDNRFSGADRVGDADQLALAITSRFIDPQGREKLRASVGEIFYFRDRKVTLPSMPVESESESDLIAELFSEWNSHATTQATMLWNNRENEIGRSALSFRYRWDQDRITHLTYRYERDVIEQLQWAVLMPLKNNWKLFGQWHYSLLDSELLESMTGFEYDSCCWAIRVIEREYISVLDEHKRSNTLWVQLELKGLTSVGKKVSAAFRQGQLD